MTPERELPQYLSERRIAIIRRLRGSKWRRHCQYPGCGKTIPNRKWSGYCADHRAAWERERRRVAERNRRMMRAIQRGRRPRPRAPLTWGWLY